MKTKSKKHHKVDLGSASSFQLYGRLLSYALVYWKIFTLAIIGMVIVASASTAFTALMKPMMDGSFVERDPDTIAWVPLAIIAIFSIRILGAYAASYGMSIIGRNVIREIRREMFSRLLSLPKSFYDQATTGELMSKFSFDVERVANATTKAITVVIRDSLTVMGLVGWMFYLNVKLAMIFITVAPIVAAIIILVSKRFRHISKNIQNSMGNVSRIIEESIKGQLVVKIFGGREYEEKQFAVVNNINHKQNLRMQKTQALSSPVVQFLVACALALIVYMATHDNSNGEITVGTFVSFIIAMSMMMPPVRSLTSIVSTLQKGIAAAESVFGFIDLKQEHDLGKYNSDSVKGLINFEQINFTYQGEETRALTDIDLTIEVGQTVAFVGRSGSGKSTLLNLIPRLYDVHSGKILLDNIDVQDYSLENLRSHISYVGQDVVLFNDSIEHNIAYGSMKSCSHDEIVEAAKAAYAYDFIKESSNGFQTMVGERGVMLSGGQRQRIAIARALLNNAPVLILDEATSALDTESERYIQHSLEKLMQNRTTLITAHRLSTIENADVIVVMDQGKIVEKGTHEELLTLNGHYSALHQMNFEEE
ncbi:Lipid A export permease/ATP-binding protein MsbA [hydrothermal vent metagenome]|uniref:Lipid A export permease/ATP-binding protein MsbA n=1 Tax=hydrothermal vent metagenome TaxID=652676 RepID=A0A3B0X9S2_9ZZZZ